MSDGPHGVRQEISADSWVPAGWTTDFATYLPTGTATAATWNPDLARKLGKFWVQRPEIAIKILF